MKKVVIFRSYLSWPEANFHMCSKNFPKNPWFFWSISFCPHVSPPCHWIGFKGQGLQENPQIFFSGSFSMGKSMVSGRFSLEPRNFDTADVWNVSRTPLLLLSFVNSALRSCCRTFDLHVPWDLINGGGSPSLFLFVRTVWDGWNPGGLYKGDTRVNRCDDWLYMIIGVILCESMLYQLASMWMD